MDGAINSYILVAKPFDPLSIHLAKPGLSCLAAVQAPIIMMSQIGGSKKTGSGQNYDYRVNLKAELEIRHLHEKVDLWVVDQWQRLLEIKKYRIGID